jgi:uncharacterized lipoprotein YajG
LNSIFNQTKMTMKKIMIVFASALVLAACGTGKGEASATTDSTKAAVDSSAVTATDSTTAQITDSTIKSK